MSNNNNHKNCAFAESLVSYLYGEIGAAEKAAFEAHLQICAACGEELNGFGLARSAIREWRGLEFDKLATPVCEVPLNSGAVETTAPTSPSRFSDWRRIFAFRPVFSLSACALLIGLCGAAIFTFNSEVSDETVQNTEYQNTVKPAAAPTIQNTIEPPRSITTGDFDAPTGKAPAKTVAKKFTAPKNQTVKVAANTFKNRLPPNVPVGVAQNTNQQNENRTYQKSSVAQSLKVPRLSDGEDEEDNSVRLADLFDEIGSR